jgi:uncharacterized membrane protein
MLGNRRGVGGGGGWWVAASVVLAVVVVVVVAVLCHVLRRGQSPEAVPFCLQTLPWVNLPYGYLHNQY